MYRACEVAAISMKPQKWDKAGTRPSSPQARTSPGSPHRTVSDGLRHAPLQGGDRFCDDRWNPAITRTLVLDGAQMILIPSYGLQPL